ncbi:ABC transporter ATP-binding protein [Candidatus Roizmanbacteria bacterium]|nr:ABC transporter ATP-binding protein [Candidatus Roizmanbacteria bacterium]
MYTIMTHEHSVIAFSNVEKYFFLQHQKTLKELVQALFIKQKTLERIHALKDLSFTVEKGECVGIIGKNGAGKSTLLKLIAQVSSPTSGTATINGKVAPLIELGAGFHPELTGRENVFLNGVILGMKESFIKKKFADIVQFAELNEFIDMPVKYYSSGMYMRLAFSVAIFIEPEILLIDEILAVGDTAFQEKCLQKMNEFKKNGTTIIFVSHSMDTVKNFCDRVIYLQEGKILYDGETKKGLELYHQK